MAPPFDSRSEPTRNQARRSAWFVHGFGAVTALAYGWLSVISWGRSAVALPLFGGLMGTAWAALVALLLYQRRQPRMPTHLIVGWALLFRVIGFLGDPLLEDDHYRYLWDGWVFATQESPYGVAPLAYFDDPQVPEAFQDILSGINHPDIPTIYGPVSESAFLLSYWISPGRLFPLKIVLILADLATLKLLMGWAPATGLLIYAWNPLLIKETAFTAHPDSLALFFLVAAMALRRQGRARGTAVLAALAVGTRIHALILVPFLLFGKGRGHQPWLVFAGTLGALYLPFLVGEGGELGLAEFARSWEFNSFGYAIIAEVLPTGLVRPVAGCLFLAGYAWVFLSWRRSGSASIPGEWVYGLLFFLSPVINPWYLLWLLPFLAIRPTLWGLIATAAGGLSYVHGLYLPGWSLSPYHHPGWLRPVEWGSVTVAGLWEWLSRSARGTRFRMLAKELLGHRIAR